MPRTKQQKDRRTTAAAGSTLRDAAKRLRLNEADTLSEQAAWLESLEFARKFVAFIIGSGAIQSYSNSTDAPGVVADYVSRQRPNTAVNLDNLEKDQDQLLAALDNYGHSRRVEGLLASYWNAGQEAGYIVGIAVGQALGTGALNGGAR